MSEQIILTIRTLECDVCQRFDTVMLSEEEVKMRANSTDLGIGAYALNHNDHSRVIYFDDKGNYLGDTIAYDLHQQVKKESWLRRLTSSFSRKMKLTKA